MKPMNLLIIMADELSVRTLGCYGHPMVQTPNIDRLAASGVRFTSAYTNSPICTAARASFASGAETVAYLIRKGPMKYIHYVDYPPELYDLAKDPEEQDDIAGKPKSKPIIGELESALGEILDPEEVDRRAKRDQAALIERLGGRTHVIETAKTGATPTPGGYADDGY